MFSLFHKIYLQSLGCICDSDGIQACILKTLVHFRPTDKCLIVVGGWAIDRECLTITFVVITLNQWELDRRIMELFDLVTTSLDGGHLLDLDNLKREKKRIVSK